MVGELNNFFQKLGNIECTGYCEPYLTSNGLKFQGLFIIVITTPNSIMQVLGCWYKVASIRLKVSSCKQELIRIMLH